MPRPTTLAFVAPHTPAAARPEDGGVRPGGAGAPLMLRWLRAAHRATKGWDTSIVVAVLIWIVLRSYLIEAFRIPSASMENTLLVGDFLFVNKAIYGGGLQIPRPGGPLLPAPRDPPPPPNRPFLFSPPQDPTPNQQ